MAKTKEVVKKKDCAVTREPVVVTFTMQGLAEHLDGQSVADQDTSNEYEISQYDKFEIKGNKLVITEFV